MPLDLEIPFDKEILVFPALFAKKTLKGRGGHRRGIDMSAEGTPSFAILWREPHAETYCAVV